MKFSKMHGLGNDFMVVDSVTQNVCFSPKKIRRLSDRRKGIGFDQLLIVEPPYDPDLDFHYRIFNSDGSEVTQCGNGARCFALFVRMKRLTNKRNILVSTKSVIMVLSIIDDNLICVNMGEPEFILHPASYYVKKKEKMYTMRIAKTTIFYGVVSIGNPHCVIFVKNLKEYSFSFIGRILQIHNLFPEGINVGFMQIVSTNHILLRVYERGVGETQSCGSGACAAVAVGIQWGLLDEKVTVDLPGGQLKISWRGPGNSLYMTGYATHIYDGEICL